MQTSYEMFLLAAKTLNFTKAASLAHITQQSFSEHIKKLEKEVGSVLFTRSPRVALTESGRIFTKRCGRWTLSNAAAWCT